MDEKLTLREALASDRLDDFVGQEVIQGSELLRGSELERALALLVTQRRLLGRAFNTSALGLPEHFSLTPRLDRRSGPPPFNAAGARAHQA